MLDLPPECIQMLISGYVLGDLSPGEATLFAEMLAQDPSLNEQVAEMQEALKIAYDPPEVVPPDSLRDRILAAASAASAVTEIPPQKIESKLSLPWNRILGAIAISIIATLGIVNYRLWRVVQTANGEIAASEQLTYLLSSKEDTPEAQAKLIVSPAKLSASLIVRNLPPLPPDKAYALWTVVDKDVPYTTDEKGGILTAVFQVDESGNFEQQIAVPQPYLEPKIIRKTAITIEDVSAPQAHQGKIFISSEN
ncbi:MAG: anti-sigma factor [Cyanobacteria bacterium J06631_2]